MAANRRVIGIGELIVSRSPEDLLITHALGPCLGVVVIDQAASVGGLAHCQLPSALSDVEKLDSRPARFVDTGVALLLEQVLALGAERRRLVIKVAGGSAILDESNTFRIGERNFTVLRKLLWKNGLLIAATDVGGREPRTMSLELGSARVRLQSGQREWEL